MFTKEVVIWLFARNITCVIIAIRYNQSRDKLEDKIHE